MWVTYGSYQNKHEFDGGTMGVRWDVNGIPNAKRELKWEFHGENIIK